MSDRDVDIAPLERYRRATRRRNAIYFATVAAVVAALAVTAGVTLSRGEAAHASLRTHTPPPPSLGVQPPSQAQQPGWRSSDQVALGTSRWGGTIVTFSKHTVGGRDARSGARTWSYTRTDRTVCTAAQTTGTTIAVYALHGNCDQVSAFDSDTGRRRWTRTLDMDGMPVNGSPQYQVTSYTFLVTSPDVIYAIDPVTGYNRWTYQRFGCRIEHAVVGANGVLISQDCSPRVHCSGLKFCGQGPQLALRDGTAGRDDKSKDNPDRLKWIKLNTRSVPVSVDQVISAADPDGATLDILDLESGRSTGRLALQPRTSGLAEPYATPTGSAELVWLAGTLYAIRADGTLQWAAAAASPPDVVSTANEETITLATARITVAGDGVSILDGNDGRVIQRFVVPVPAGARAYSLGTGFLVAGASGLAAYR